MAKTIVKGSDNMIQDEKSFYCDKVNKTVKIQFDFDKLENGIYKIEGALNNQEFKCLNILYPEYCRLCTPMTKFDIWEKLIKNFISSR